MRRVCGAWPIASSAFLAFSAAGAGDRQPLSAHLHNVGGAARIAFNRPALIEQAKSIGRQCFEFCPGWKPAKIDFARSVATAARFPRCCGR